MGELGAELKRRLKSGAFNCFDAAHLSVSSLTISQQDPIFLCSSEANRHMDRDGDADMMPLFYDPAQHEGDIVGKLKCNNASLMSFGGGTRGWVAAKSSYLSF